MRRIRIQLLLVRRNRNEECIEIFVLGELLGIMWERFTGPKPKIEVITLKENDVDTYLNGGDLAMIKKD